MGFNSGFKGLRMSNYWLQSIEPHDGEPSQVLGNINFTESDVPISPSPHFNEINFGLLERKLILWDTPFCKSEASYGIDKRMTALDEKHPTTVDHVNSCYVSCDNLLLYRSEKWSATLVHRNQKMLLFYWSLMPQIT